MSGKSASTPRARPLSPHLQVYKLPYNAVMSITGRAVGIGLFVALSVICIWFCASVWSPSVFDQTIAFLNGQYIDVAMRYLFLFGAFATFFYIGNGIRHVLWNFVIGVNVKSGVLTGNIVLAVSLLLTIVLAVITMDSGTPIAVIETAEQIEQGAR